MLYKENTPLKRAFLPRLIEVGVSCPAALVNLINDSGLPAFLIFEILNGLTLEINKGIQDEIAAAEKSDIKDESTT